MNGRRDGDQAQPGSGGGRETRRGRSRDERREHRALAPRHRTAQRPSERARTADVPRRIAYDLMRAIDAGAYANLELPKRLRAAHLSGRDAAFVTELVYGATRMRGFYDPVLARCAGRDVSAIDPEALDVLRLGAHQSLSMRVRQHAAVGETVALARDVLGSGRAGFVNAVLRRVSEKDIEEWREIVRGRPGLDGPDVGAPGAGESDPRRSGGESRAEGRGGDSGEAQPSADRSDDGASPGAQSPHDASASSDDLTGGLAVEYSHPAWVVRALRAALLGHGASTPTTVDADLVALLAADNDAPTVSLVARPGLAEVSELVDAGAPPCRTRASGIS